MQMMTRAFLCCIKYLRAFCPNGTKDRNTTCIKLKCEMKMSKSSLSLTAGICNKFSQWLPSTVSVGLGWGWGNGESIRHITSRK